MSNRSSFFVRLDDDWMQDDKIRKLRREKGYEGVGVYFALITLERRYYASAYEIPFDALKVIAEEDIFLPSEKLKEIVEFCCLIGLFKISSSKNSFFSVRRKNELIAAERTREKQKKAAEETNQKKNNDGIA